RRLVRSHAEDVNVDAKPVQQIGKEQLTAAETGQKQLPHRMQIDGVGIGSQQILRLTVVVAISKQGLAAGLELVQRRAYGFQHDRTGASHLGQIQNHRLDALVTAGTLQRLHDIPYRSALD